MRTRHQQREATRTRLSDVALTRFKAQGYHKTTVEEIASDAGVSRRTFFRYFPSKEAVFFADSAFRLTWFSEILAERLPKTDTWTAVTGGLLEVACSLADDPARALELHHILSDSPALHAIDLRHDQAWEQEICAAFERGGVAPLPAAITAGALMGTIRAVLRAWYHTGCKGDLIAMGRDSFALLARGLSA